MRFFVEILENHALWTALLGWFVAQLLKVITVLLRDKRFDVRRLVGSGGMPSSHTAFVVSTAIATARQCGTASTEFALAAVLASVVIYDAMGVRRAAGEQAKILNKMIDEWIDKTYWSEKSLPQIKKLKEMLGHTPLEVLGGFVVAIVVSMLVV